jgi:hypothetical protein
MTVKTAQNWWSEVQKREGLRQKLNYTRGFVRGYYAGYKQARK